MAKDKKPRQKSQDNAALQKVIVNPSLNKFKTGDHSFMLNNIKFLIAGKENVVTNHKPEGIYIEANDILKFVAQNLRGHKEEATKENKK